MIGSVETELDEYLKKNLTIEVYEESVPYSNGRDKVTVVLCLKGEEITTYLAKLKAAAFEGLISANDIVITSDTIVWFKDRALEKPKNKQEAIEMLESLSGDKHEVYTSICIKTLNTQHVFSDTTIVHFKQLTADEINFYVENYNPFDKAGGYGIQEWIGYIGIEKIDGSFYNVMGLPVLKLYEELRKF